MIGEGQQRLLLSYGKILRLLAEAFGEADMISAGRLIGAINEAEMVARQQAVQLVEELNMGVEHANES